MGMFWSYGSLTNVSRVLTTKFTLFRCKYLNQTKDLLKTGRVKSNKNKRACMKRLVRMEEGLIGSFVFL